MLGIKRHKKQATPNFNKAKYIRGIRIAKGYRADATADYLETRQWQNGEGLPERKTNPSKVVDHETGIDIGNITGKELDSTIQQMTRNKALICYLLT